MCELIKISKLDFIRRVINVIKRSKIKMRIEIFEKL